MISKCFLWVDHNFEFVPDQQTLRCTRCRRRWPAEGGESFPEGYKSWKEWDNRRQVLRENGIYNAYILTVKLKIAGTLPLTDRAQAYAEAIIKEKKWQNSPKSMAYIRKQAKLNPELFLHAQHIPIYIPNI